jgi:hypothetical protein
VKWILMVAVVVAVQTAVTRSYRSSLKREPHEVNGYMIGPGADLRRADLFGADLEGVDLSGADLGGALLSGVNLIGARANKNTTWPDGFDPKAAGVTFE